MGKGLVLVYYVFFHGTLIVFFFFTLLVYLKLIAFNILYHNEITTQNDVNTLSNELHNIKPKTLITFVYKLTFHNTINIRK